MVIFKAKRTVKRFFHPAAVSAVAGSAALLLSGCGSGGDSSGGSDGRSSTLTRAYFPLQASDSHVFLAKASDSDTETATIQESVSGPTESINGIDEKVFQVATTPFGSETAFFYTFQNLTDKGLINYGADSFQAFDLYGNLLRHVETGPRLSAPFVYFAPPLKTKKTGTRAQQLLESIRYDPVVVLPFGLERGRSTTIQRLDFKQVYSSDTPSTYDPQSYRFINEGRETVRVPMGTFDCVKIKQELGTLDLKEVYQVRRFWYAEDIGLIQYKEEYPDETPSSGLSYQAVSAFVGGKQYP